ncbi:hypothetical protein D3C86_1874870 [compost metagenome]
MLFGHTWPTTSLTFDLPRRGLDCRPRSRSGAPWDSACLSCFWSSQARHERGIDSNDSPVALRISHRIGGSVPASRVSYFGHFLWVVSSFRPNLVYTTRLNHEKNPDYEFACKCLVDCSSCCVCAAGHGCFRRRSQKGRRG